MRTLARNPKATRLMTSAKPMTLGRTNFGQSTGLSSSFHLRRTIGNHAPRELFEANSAPVGGDSAATKFAHFAHDFSRIPVHAKVAIKLQTQLGISKRGDAYLRTLLISGARAIVARSAPSSWIERLLQRRNINVVVTALANKMARTIWAILAKGAAFDQEKWNPTKTAIA